MCNGYMRKFQCFLPPPAKTCENIGVTHLKMWNAARGRKKIVYINSQAIFVFYLCELV